MKIKLSKPFSLKAIDYCVRVTYFQENRGFFKARKLHDKKGPSF